MNDEKIIKENEVIVLESIPTKIMYKDFIWVHEVKKIIDTSKFKKPAGNVKRAYIIKWVEKKKVGDVFTKDEFYDEYPTIKREKARRMCVDEAVQNMILDGVITVHDNIPGKYKVLK